jgi:hypothetical protein
MFNMNGTFYAGESGKDEQTEKILEFLKKSRNFTEHE